jgi:integrase
VSESTITVPAERPSYPREPRLLRHDDPTEQHRVGPVDALLAPEILEQLPALPTWPAKDSHATPKLRGAATILKWLLTHPGDGWQERWLASGADTGTAWIDDLIRDDPRSPTVKRNATMAGLNCLLLSRVVLPSYTFLTNYSAAMLFRQVEQVLRPDLFARAAAVGQDAGLPPRHVREGLRAIAKMVLHTGRDIDELTAEDVYGYRAHGIDRNGHSPTGTYSAWELLRRLDLVPDIALGEALRRGQRPTAELVDRHQIQCQAIRDVLVRYLDERRPSMDYGSFNSLASRLAGTFWADIERHHPGIDALNLPAEVAEAWKQRMQFVAAPGKKVRPRKNPFELFMRVRSFYLDIAEWALEDPSWAPFAVPSPIRRSDTEGHQKQQKKTTAEMHQRVRERLPHLPTLVEAAERHREEQSSLLAAARGTPLGEIFEHHGITYRRITYKYSDKYAKYSDPDTSGATLIENVSTSGRTDLTREEEDAFWAWAIIETLRLTGVRVEELLEITHLALVSYRLPGTGEIVPLLQIVPSKSDEERLLLVSPELASVLATIVTRLRDHNGGKVPLVARYDDRERVTGPPLPHLFQRKIGWRWTVLGTTKVYDLLTDTIGRAGLRDAAGQPLRYTPHDFRRMFVTEAVTGGLPVHIAARLLGHQSIATTQAYLAVFQDDLIRAYRSFLDQRRAVRPEVEYREPTADEWLEFQKHFELRKLELGTCGRPYGTPCKHEHACIRCPMLRVDPRQRARLIEIIQNLRDRISEAEANGWLGEVQGLQSSLQAARDKLTALERTRRNGRTGTTDLGMPILPEPTP